MIRKALCWFGLLVAVLAARAAQSDEATFPRPEALEPAVRFWTRVYTEVDTRGGFIHDSERLDIVYETIRTESGGRAERRRAVDAAVSRYRRILNKLADGARSDLSAEEQRVLELFPEGTSNAELARAAQRLRFQLGQSDRFRAGLIRSGIWRDHIADVLDENGVPAELVALPHVESSFDPTAYSRVGAAGMWQFTRSTGLRYMRIDHVVDERRDPFMSTHAAARLLRDNHEVLQHWPLAITAYNHGVGGMRRAVRQLGTTDIGEIVQRYNGRTFGFASRNFYAAFLAAADIDADPERFFGPLELRAPSQTRIAKVPDYMGVETVARTLNLPVGELRRLNPALMDTVWSGDKFVPRGFELRVPAGAAGADVDTLFAAVPAGERYAAQQPDVSHRVRPGETLSQIASRYGASVQSLVRMNGLRNSHFIRAGQVLTLPGASGTTPPTLAEQRGDSADGEYVVRRGDSIATIARALNVDADALLRANDIRDRNLIYAGQTLRVPGGDGASSQADAVADDAADEPREQVVAASGGAAPDSATETAVGRPAGAGAAASLVADTGGAARETAEPGDTAAPAPSPASGVDGGHAAGDEEATLESNALASHQADLAADPSDYSVTDGVIEVQALETLGHYADWLEIRTQRLRDLNGMPFRQAVVIGQKLRLDFSRVTPEEFEQRRVAYQRNRQESFFSSYDIDDVADHVISRGESVWVLARRTYDVPVWLLHQYNPDIDLDRVTPGTVVKFPRLTPVEEEGEEDQVST